MKSIFIYGQKNILINYERAFECEDCKVTISKRLPNVKKYDCLVLAGGGDIVPNFYGQQNLCCENVDEKRDKAELFLIKKFLTQNKRVIGICRGMQVLNVYFGGTLFQNVYYHSQQNGKDGYHFVYNYTKSFMYDLYGKSCLVNSAHHQAIDKLGDGLIKACISPDGYIEGFYHKNLPVYAVQFHPERMSNGKRLINFFKPWN